MYSKTNFGDYSGLAGFWGAAPPKITPEMLEPLPQMETVGPSPELQDPLIGPMPAGPMPYGPRGPLATGYGYPVYPPEMMPPRIIVMQDPGAEKMPEYIIPAMIIFIISLFLFKKQ